MSGLYRKNILFNLPQRILLTRNSNCDWLFISSLYTLNSHCLVNYHSNSSRQVHYTPRNRLIKRYLSKDTFENHKKDPLTFAVKENKYQSSSICWKCGHYSFPSLPICDNPQCGAILPVSTKLNYFHQFNL